MKNLKVAAILSAVILITVVLVAKPGIAAIDSESVVAIWLFDEGAGNVAKDSSGNGHDGEIKGGLKWIDGPMSGALEFPGQNGSFVLVPHDDGLDVITFTMITWIKAMNTGGRQEIIMKRSQGGDNSQNLHFQIESGREGPDVGFTADGQWVTGLFANASVVDEEWHHIAATYDQEKMQIYVDGVLDGEQARSSTPDNNTAPLTIGAVFETGGSPLNGALDDVGLFNVALEEDDIIAIMENGLAEVVGVQPVSPAGKLPGLWGRIKTQSR